MINTHTLGHRLRKIRELRNLTQEYVAQRLGISQSNYARMENDDISIPDKRLAEISEILKTTPDAIRNFDEAAIFNITQGDTGNCAQPLSVDNFQISSELRKLYEDKIRLLEEKISFLEEKVDHFTRNK